MAWRRLPSAAPASASSWRIDPSKLGAARARGLRAVRRGSASFSSVSASVLPPAQSATPMLAPTRADPSCRVHRLGQAGRRAARRPGRPGRRRPTSSSRTTNSSPPSRIAQSSPRTVAAAARRRGGAPGRRCVAEGVVDGLNRSRSMNSRAVVEPLSREGRSREQSEPVGPVGQQGEGVVGGLEGQLVLELEPLPVGLGDLVDGHRHPGDHEREQHDGADHDGPDVHPSFPTSDLHRQRSGAIIVARPAAISLRRRKCGSASSRRAREIRAHRVVERRGTPAQVGGEPEVVRAPRCPAGSRARRGGTGVGEQQGGHGQHQQPRGAFHEPGVVTRRTSAATSRMSPRG